MTIDWLRWSLLSQGVLFAYYQLIEWVDLFPWNDIRNGNGQVTVDLIVAVVMVVLVLITTSRVWWLMGIPPRPLRLLDMAADSELVAAIPTRCFSYLEAGLWTLLRPNSQIPSYGR